ncbi:Lrp/AsnC family transcriptional regulator [Salipiger mucosus]|uniref:Transcriptional regulator, AsnC family n=1 Tax=Salipiger mucosus DSM 16094 TaxID=1123237 RepID=S9Q8B9_9RHOB|nr:Lrp/AsnC family transcriptional regulator [Salipiger mucosus]EPX75873.1 hypothetical protein Salmuc_03160 [Salipiger mucosus DSM 16094]
MTSSKLDWKDREILQCLMREGRISVDRLSELVGLSPTPVRRRLRQLEDDGLI